MGIHGNALLKNNARILTHCNAGWLAFADYGSALSPIYQAHRESKNVFVYVDETRPRSQGARLTAWELHNEKVPHTIIPDNAGAYLASKGKIDIMICGADRIAANGDTANKIGTFEKAIIAKTFGIPFYIAAPISTFDIHCNSGDDIIIEERSEDEVLYQTGLNENNELTRILVCSPGSSAYNPAFDVTPASYISGFITERGIFPAEKSIIKNMIL
jgi:S-methyl-5-thioribose-1-phosphate isomerase